MSADLVVVINPFQEKGSSFKLTLFLSPADTANSCATFHSRNGSAQAAAEEAARNAVEPAKLYPESVEELSSKPLLEATEGEKTSFHASGREDIDARMLGTGRPFVIEISKPKKRFVDLKEIEAKINAEAVGKVQVSRLRFTTKDVVRRLKKGEGAQKKYRLLAEFENEVSEEDLRMLEEKLSGALIKQQTPLRVVHRRADLIRERYIYKFKVRKVSLKRALYGNSLPRRPLR